METKSSLKKVSWLSELDAVYISSLIDTLPQLSISRPINWQCHSFKENDAVVAKNPRAIRAFMINTVCPSEDFVICVTSYSECKFACTNILGLVTPEYTITIVSGDLYVIYDRYDNVYAELVYSMSNKFYLVHYPGFTVGFDDMYDEKTLHNKLIGKVKFALCPKQWKIWKQYVRWKGDFLHRYFFSSYLNSDCTQIIGEYWHKSLLDLAEEVQVPFHKDSLNTPYVDF